MRDTKRKIQNMQTAIDNCRDEKLKFELQQEFDRKSYLLKKQNTAYKQYCEDNNLKPYAERLRTDRGYIALKECKNAEGRSLIAYEQMETIQSEPTGQ